MSAGDETNLEPSQWLERFGDQLYGFALAKVSRSDVAEDLVQETLLAAWAARSTFHGRSTLQTWLIGILRRKIVDHYRRTTARRQITTKEPNDAALQLLFDERGVWRHQMNAWSDLPSDELVQREFWTTVDACIAKLPDSLASAFRLREMEQLDTREVCEILSISSANLSVRLHRARLLLRECLDENWFQRSEIPN